MGFVSVSTRLLLHTCVEPVVHAFLLVLRAVLRFIVTLKSAAPAIKALGWL